jgi:hypothetical protein
VLAHCDQARAKTVKKDLAGSFNLFQLLESCGGAVCATSAAKVFESGVYGLAPQRGSATDIIMRKERGTVFGNIVARRPSESDKTYVKRICSSSSSQSDSQQPHSVRIELEPTNFLNQNLFCPVACSLQPSFFGKGAILCLMDKGSVIDPRRIWPCNRTIVVLKGSVTLLHWEPAGFSKIDSSITLDIFCDNPNSRRLVNEGMKPSVLKVCKGQCAFVRSGAFLSLVAAENSGNILVLSILALVTSTLHFLF